MPKTTRKVKAAPKRQRNNYKLTETAPKVTARDFRAAAERRNFHPTSVEAARLVLVQGASLAEAGKLNAMSRQQVWGIVKEFEREIEYG